MQLTKYVMLLTLAASLTNAAAITGQLWSVPNAVASNAIPANIPATAPDVTFQVNAPFNFNNGGSVGQFLASGGAFNVVGPASALSAPISPSLIEFVGQVDVTTGDTFTVTHDDGLTLIIGGLTVISTPGPTGPVQTTMTYNGPTGTLPFTLVYGECCGGSAVLQLSLPLQPTQTNGPEPATWGMFAAMLAMGGIARKMSRRRLA